MSVCLSLLFSCTLSCSTIWRLAFCVCGCVFIFPLSIISLGDKDQLLTVLASFSSSHSPLWVPFTLASYSFCLPQGLCVSFPPAVFPSCQHFPRMAPWTLTLGDSIIRWWYPLPSPVCGWMLTCCHSSHLQVCFCCLFRYCGLSFPLTIYWMRAGAVSDLLTFSSPVITW